MKDFKLKLSYMMAALNGTLWYDDEPLIGIEDFDSADKGWVHIRLSPSGRKSWYAGEACLSGNFAWIIRHPSIVSIRRNGAAVRPSSPGLPRTK